MDIPLFDALLERQPKFNQKLTQGLAAFEMPFVERYVEERIWKVAAQDFPAQVQYVGCRRATPEEALNDTLKRQKRAFRKTTFETAPSDFYTMFYQLSFEGELMEEIPIQLPSVRPGGLIRIRGAWFHITPVVADVAISVGMDSIFMRFNKLRTNLFRLPYHYFLDGRRDSPYMVYGKLHNAQIKSRGRSRSLLTKMKTILPHYLFARYGLKQAFALYCNAAVEVGTADEITTEKYPPKDWVICSSIHQNQQPAPNGRLQLGTNLRMAVRRNAETEFGITPDTRTMVGAFFYVADHFPNRVTAEYADEERLWVVLLGHLLFGSDHSEGKLAEDVYTHLRSLDSGLDQEYQVNLRKIGIYCSSMYDFMANISFTFSNRVTDAMSTVASMYGKRLMILRYVMDDLRNAVNRFMFQIDKDANSRKRPLRREDVENALRRHIKPDVVYKISGSAHGEVTSVSCPGDNMLFKLTCQAVLQADSSGPRSRTGTAGGRSGVDASRQLDVSIAEVGSYNTMSKSEPSGRNKLNPYLSFDSDGVLVQDPKMAPLLDKVQALIRR